MRIVSGSWSLALALALAGCGSKKSGQSFRAGMELVCSAGEQPDVTRRNPAERARAMSQWIDGAVHNAEARAAFTKFGEARPAEGAKILAEAAQRAGLARCALATAAAAGGVDLVEAPASAVLAEAPTGLMLVVTETAMVLDGTEVVAVHAGQVDPADVEGGARGLAIPKLAALAAAQAAHNPSPLAIAAVPTTTYQTLVRAVSSVRTSYPTLALLVRSHDGVGAVPLTFPATNRLEADLARLAASGGEAKPAAPPLQMAMMISADRVMLFSFDGREGSPGQPLTQVALADVAAAATEVATALAAVAARNPAAASPRQLIVMAPPGAPLATVLPLMAAARASFPELVLSTGIN